VGKVFTGIFFIWFFRRDSKLPGFNNFRILGDGGTVIISGRGMLDGFKVLIAKFSLTSKEIGRESKTEEGEKAKAGKRDFVWKS